MKSNAVNVPGKILFFGGYSVLEEGHEALSFAVVDGKNKGIVASAKESKEDILISKQFHIKQAIDLNNFNKDNVAITAFHLTKLYLQSKGYGKSFAVELENSPMFGIEYKSGLGSSAAATVAVVKSLFEANNLDSDFETIHKLSQYSYAVYSGKVGSGFDIATCSTGHTILYKRFSPSDIKLPSDYNDMEKIVGKLLSSLRKSWKGLSIRQVSIPENYKVLFFKIEGGKTSTISNVKAVMEWKSKNKEEYIKLMEKQNDFESKAIKSLLKKDNDSLRENTHQAREVHRTLQNLVRESIKDFNPIEPELLTKLIEFGESLKGIVAGRCPGAGGWDGLAFIVDKEGFDKEDAGKLIRAGNDQKLKLKHIPLRLV